MCDGYKAYESAFKLETRIEAGCMAHARRKFYELIKENQRPVAAQAVQRIAWLYRIEREARELHKRARLAMRHVRAGPLCEELLLWLGLERQRVPDGSAIASVIDYSLNRWTALTAYLVDGNVAIDNNHIENLMRPWAMGRKAWLFAGSELAAVVMSLAQSVRMNGHDPWAYLRHGWSLTAEAAKPISMLISDTNGKADAGHGRIESRKCIVSSELDWLEQKAQWSGLSSIAMIEETRERKGAYRH